MSVICVCVVCICVVVCIFIKLHRTAQFGPVVLLIVILCHSHWSSQGGMINDTCCENVSSDATTYHTTHVNKMSVICVCVCVCYVCVA